MRLVAMILLALGLATSVAAGAPPRDDARLLASAQAAGGSLSIEDGRGTVTIGGKGVLVGRIEKGSLEILDLTPATNGARRERRSRAARR